MNRQHNSQKKKDQKYKQWSTKQYAETSGRSTRSPQKTQNILFNEESK